jgi:hypothetical protein
MLMNARSGLPAKTTSQGSSPGMIVAVTLSVVRLTTLTVSLILFATHTSVFVRARTDTGSRPVGIDATCTGSAAPSVNTSSRLSAVFVTRSFVPSGVISTGCTGGVSKL